MSSRKKPFSGKAKKQQLKEKRERNRQRRAIDSDDEDASKTEEVEEVVTPVQSGRGDLRTVFQAEPRSAIEKRKKDATRTLVYAADRGNSQSIYEYGIHNQENQPPILLKPKWSLDLTPEELIAAEDEAYRAWIHELETIQVESGQRYNLFERNIEVWRQLWRTVERSDVLVHLADARCPPLHLSRRLLDYIRDSFPSKRVIIVLTKADLVSPQRVMQWEAYVKDQLGDLTTVLSYNQTDAEHCNTSLLKLIGQTGLTIDRSQRDVLRREDEDTLTVGFVGEPNVGKSSLLNSVFERKLVSVSSTPGHTKHLQTHYFERVELLECSSVFNRVLVCDCPGVVFPRLNVPVALQILFGSFPIAQTREPYSAIRFIAENCDPPMDEIYKLTPVEEDDDEWTPYTLCEAYAKQRGFHIKGGRLDLHRAANLILRDTLNGQKVVLSFPPPALTVS
ncbi:hypothetical protein Poli38472_013497 [Pythium oligandrum]|uniref:Guanine nucleotide-binding protein-like 1 n=1 Tax=Pythium oligandrum TaxID=41045 RepID=A0A8K1C7W1_PYTOL|nr:hypothetical protein Poli38472_013497 [Pythium oligandrum]|eukprot:TMW58023.1 hypothetical protein Poli38472_013497 [Pythium oligandrum]